MKDQPPVNLHQLQSIWASLSPDERKQFLAHNPRLGPIVSPLTWMLSHTKTKDEQDATNPYKPFPNRSYFHDLHAAWESEPILFVKKSRTMMATWVFTAFCLHYAMNRPATRVLFMAQDEERSLIPLDYCWTLWEQSADWLKDLWPIDRPRDKQAYNLMEFKNETACCALPGKDPDKIRGFHPSVIMFDEAADMEKFGEAFDIGLAARPLKIVAVSSAKPGDFEEITKVAEEIKCQAV